MAIRIERSGARTVVSQRRRALRIAVWGIVFFALAGTAMMVWDGLSVRHTDITCRRADGRCQVDRGTRSGSRVLSLADISGIAVEEEDGRVAAVFARPEAGSYQLCEAAASDPQAASIRDAVAALDRFLRDPAAGEVTVGCDSRGAGDSPGALAVRTLASLGGVGLMLLGLVIFLVEIRTEIDRDAGLVRVAGRSAFPRRRWSVERGVGEVTGVVVQRRGRGASKSWVVYLGFRDDSATLVLAPTTGSTRKVNRWMAELREALGLPAPPASS